MNILRRLLVTSLVIVACLAFLWLVLVLFLKVTVINTQIKSEISDSQLFVVNPLSMASWLRKVGYASSKNPVRVNFSSDIRTFEVKSLNIVFTDKEQPSNQIKNGDSVVSSAGFQYDSNSKKLEIKINNLRDSNQSDKEYTKGLEFSMLDILYRINIHQKTGEEAVDLAWRKQFTRNSIGSSFLKLTPTLKALISRVFVGEVYAQACGGSLVCGTMGLICSSTGQRSGCGFVGQACGLGLTGTCQSACVSSGGSNGDFCSGFPNNECSGAAFRICTSPNTTNGCIYSGGCAIQSNPPPPPSCTCDSWVPISSCGNTCQPNERRYTRNCNPTGCNVSNSCFAAAECGGTPTPPPVVGNVTGYHDAWSGNVTIASSQCAAAGWAKDPDNTNQDINVRVLSDGVVVASRVASDARGDLGGECPGGTCAFNNIGLSGLISNGVNHTITVQGQDLQTGGWVTLNNTPKTLNCCGAVSAPTVTAPTSPIACNTASTNVTWTAVPNATEYALRIDDTSNGWTGTCATVNAGDVCLNQSGTTYNKALVAGRTYNVWVHAINSCGGWSAPSPTYTFTAMGSLTLSGSQNIQSGTSSTFIANLNPSVSIGRVDFSTSNNGVAVLTPASDNNAAGGYSTSVQGASAGTSNIGASAYSGSGAFLCSAPTVPVTVTSSASAWWQVRGGDVSVAGALISMIPNTCSGACVPIFNLRNTLVPTGSINQYSGTGDFSATGGAGTGAQPTDWKVDAGTQLSQTYNYNFFRNSVPSSWEANIINIPGATLDVTQIPTMGTAVGGYYVLYKNGDLTLTGDSGISNNKYIFFVENGDLTLGNAASSRFIVNDGVGFLMAIVGKGTNPAKGNIIVSPSVVSSTQTDYRYEGLFLAEGQFRTSTGGRLSLRGSYAALGGFDLDRDLADDSATPAEFFDFAPHLLMTYPIALTNKRIRWQEVAP